jgi:hypothetical protein
MWGCANHTLLSVALIMLVSAAKAGESEFHQRTMLRSAGGKRLAVQEGRGKDIHFATVRILPCADKFQFRIACCLGIRALLGPDVRM